MKMPVLMLLLGMAVIATSLPVDRDTVSEINDAEDDKVDVDDNADEGDEDEDEDGDEDEEEEYDENEDDEGNANEEDDDNGDENDDAPLRDEDVETRNL